MVFLTLYSFGAIFPCGLVIKEVFCEAVMSIGILTTAQFYQRIQCAFKIIVPAGCRGEMFRIFANLLVTVGGAVDVFLLPNLPIRVASTHLNRIPVVIFSVAAQEIRTLSASILDPGKAGRVLIRNLHTLSKEDDIGPFLRVLDFQLRTHMLTVFLLPQAQNLLSPTRRKLFGAFDHV